MSDPSKPPHFPEPDAEGVVEDAPSPEETELAEALARALENSGPRAHGHDARGHDARGRDPQVGALLETATLVKVSQQFDLTDERKQRARAELERALDERARRLVTRASRRPFWLRVPLITAGLVGVFGLLMVLHTSRSEAPAQRAAAPSEATTVATERPPATLLRAQAHALAEAVASTEEPAGTPSANATKPSPKGPEAASPGSLVGPSNRTTLDRELGAYRSTLMASLDERLR